MFLSIYSTFAVDSIAVVKNRCFCASQNVHIQK